MSPSAPSRLQQLLAFYEEDPTDPFTIYALATEYRADDPKLAWEYYQKLASCSKALARKKRPSKCTAKA